MSMIACPNCGAAGGWRFTDDPGLPPLFVHDQEDDALRCQSTSCSVMAPHWHTLAPDGMPWAHPDERIPDGHIRIDCQTAAGGRLPPFVDRSATLDDIRDLLIEIRDIVGAQAEVFGVVARLGQDGPEPEDRTRESWTRRSDT